MKPGDVSFSTLRQGSLVRGFKNNRKSIHGKETISSFTFEKKKPDVLTSSEARD